MALFFGGALHGQELLKEVISREYTVNIGGLSVPDVKEVVSREISVMIGDEPTPLYKDIVSREVSLVVATNAVPAPVAAISIQASPSGETVTLDWRSYGELAERDVVRYAIYRSTQPFTTVASLTPATTVPAGTSTYTFTGLPAFQDQYFAVVPVDALNGFIPVVNYAANYVLGAELISREYTVDIGGLSVPESKELVSRELSFVVGTNVAPAAIASIDVTVAPDGQSVALDWRSYNEVAERDVLRYDIYLQTSPFTSVVGLTPYASVPAGTLQRVIGNLPGGGDLYFAVVAVDALGNFASTVNYAVAAILFPEIISREFTVNVGGASTPELKEIVSREVSFVVPTAAVPDPVTGLNSGFVANTSAVAYGAVDLDWTTYNEVAQRDVVRYRIYLGTSFFDTVTGLTPTAVVFAGTQRFTLTGLNSRGIYYLAVVAEDALGQFSSVVRSVSAQATPAAAGEVRNLAVASEPTALTFTWDPPLGASPLVAAYRIYFDGAATPVVVPSGTTTYRITGLLPNRGYPFRISTYDIFNTESTGASLFALTSPTAPAPFSGTHAVVGAGYVAGGTLTVTNTITYSGTLSSLSWQVLLPAGHGWSYASGAGSEGGTKPAVGAIELLEWAWPVIPPSPVTFTYTLNIPAGSVEPKTLAALLSGQQAGTFYQVLVQPDPLPVNATLVHHSADTDQNFRISLLELTRVIELYNTRNGTTRTGAYKVDAAGEDGFAPDPARANNAVVTLPLYHSADTTVSTPTRDGKISLIELTRVIELYNYRAGTTRTGQYHVQGGTEDGFAPGP